MSQQQLQAGHIALHISGLPKTFDEAKLIEVIQKNFSKDFLIDSVYVCKDWNTHKSRGSAYVNSSLENAQKIINIMNHMELEGSELNITMKYHEAPSKDANLFIGNLNENTDYNTFDKEFGKFGEILSTKMKPLPESSKKVGYVQYKRVEDANKAIKEMNGVNFSGKSIIVNVFKPYDERVNQNFTSVHIQNFEEVSKEELKNIFSKFGELSSEPYIFPKPKEHDGIITYSASITYKEHADAVKAIDNLNGKPFASQNSLVEVCRHKSKLQRKKDSKNVPHKTEFNLFLSGLSDKTTIEELRETMKQFGEIDSVRIMYDDEGKSRQYGYCSYKDQDSTNKAKGANGTFINGSPLMIKSFMPAYMRKQQRQNVLNKAKNSHYNTNKNRNYNKHGKQTKASHHAPAQAAPAPAPVKQTPAIEAIPKAEFDAMDEEDKHETFGEKIYEYVQTNLPSENPGKITGMILESFKNNYSALNSVIASGKIVDKIKEAIEVLKKHNN